MIKCCGAKNLPSDRSLLENIQTDAAGEGMVVRFIGFVIAEMARANQTWVRNASRPNCCSSWASPSRLGRSDGT